MIERPNPNLGMFIPTPDHHGIRRDHTLPPANKQITNPLPPLSDLAKKYPAYHKDVSDVSSLDVYHIHKLFNIQDPSGCIQHASKKLLLSGVRTGGKSVRKDIQEARDTLQRWLDLYPAN